MRVEVIKNFATKEEIIALNDWVRLGVQNKWLDIGVTDGYKPTKDRLTSRMYGRRFIYPEEALKLSERVRKCVGVEGYPFIAGHGKNGIVVSYTMNGGDVYRHRDPRGSSGLATLRCNILTQKADLGGVLFVDGQQIDVEVGDLHCYLVSEHEHWATTVGGDTPRIMWMFGAHVPAVVWNNGAIKVNNGLS